MYFAIPLGGKHSPISKLQTEGEFFYLTGPLRGWPWCVSFVVKIGKSTTLGRIFGHAQCQMMTYYQDNFLESKIRASYRKRSQCPSLAVSLAAESFMMHLGCRFWMSTSPTLYQTFSVKKFNQIWSDYPMITVHGTVQRWVSTWRI